MNGPDGTAAREPLDLLVERFLHLHRAGSGISVDAFAAEHPQHTADLRELLPALLALEQAKRTRAATGSGEGRAPVAKLERLGDFRIVREVGRGGMGVVFEAVQESLARKVALKVLPPSALLTEHQLERFRREAAIAAQLHHTNIVPVFGSGSGDGHHWYAMQFIAGTSLDRWRDEQQQAPPAGSGAWRSRARFVARLGAQAAGALHYAHGLGTLHRDVKPANLLLDANDQAWITDFGLAKALEGEALTQAGDVLGTLQYMAPEQFAGSYDARSEVYALGVTLYELLALRPAFAGRSRSELMERIRTHALAPLRRVCPEVPVDLAVIVERAIARDPADRYQDAGALQRDLQAFLDDRAIAARRLSAAERLWRWCRRNRGMAALAASTLLALAGAAVTGWVAYGVTEKESARAEKNLGLALAGFGEVFDALVGRDPLLVVDEDPDTGEQTVIARTVVDPASIELLQKMLGFYEAFAAQNAGNQSLRVETARAYRRVGAIHVRLGKPDNLTAAAHAYEQALERLASVTDRDVKRDLATVYVDQGRLEQRRSDAQGAARHFLEAIALFEQSGDRDTPAVRFERAQAHWLLAVLADPLQVRGDGDRRGGFRPLRSSRAHLQQALDLVAGLLAAEPDNREFRAMHARCLLLGSRLPERGARDASQRRDEQRNQGVAILRELVAAHPGAARFRFELAEALADPRSADLPALQEARAHAQKLVTDEPLAAEYQSLLARVATTLGRALREQAERVPDAEKAELRRQAVSELQTAVRVGSALLPPQGPGDALVVRQVAEARRLLAVTYLGDRRRQDGVRELEALLDLLEAQGPSLRMAPRWTAELHRFVGNLRQEDLRKRVEALRAAMPQRGESLADPRRAQPPEQQKR